MDAFLAFDWGTTNRRIYHVQEGRVLMTARDDLGVSACRPDRYAAEIAAVRSLYGDLPVLLAGMIGSTIGWKLAPYVDLPAGLDDLAASLTWATPTIAIVPGVAQRHPSDVMRGEEVQLLGAAAAGLVPDDALLCQPGTHCKWAFLNRGKIGSFATSMTGELFGLLRNHSILADQLDGVAADGESFREGVRRGAEHGLQTELFRIRARGILDGDRDAAAFASGLLIGDDVARYAKLRDIYVLADGSLAELYTAALNELGGKARSIDSHAAFVAGIVQIGERIR